MSKRKKLLQNTLVSFVKKKKKNRPYGNEDREGEIEQRKQDRKKCGATAQSGEATGQSRELCGKTGETRDSGEKRGEEIGQSGKPSGQGGQGGQRE